MKAAVLDEPVVPFDDLAVLERAWRGAAPGGVRTATRIKRAQLSISRLGSDDFQDRQIYLWVDGEAWGKIRYGRTMTREIAPGRHTVRAFNTLFSRTIEVEARPGEHVRLRCANGFPKAGWLMMIFLHVTYLLVRLEQVDSHGQTISGPFGGQGPYAPTPIDPHQ
jgi:hypothetical protein